MHITANREDLVFSTLVLPAMSRDEFIIEFYPTKAELDGQPAPVKVTRNFEELIGFFEEMEKE